MFKEFINIGKNAIIYGIPDIVAKAVGFVMIPIYTRFLTPEDYGIISMLMLLTSFVGMILPLGINSAFGRFYFDGKDEKEKNVVFSTALLFMTVSAFAAVTICMLFSKQISAILFSSPNNSLYVIIMLAALFFQTLQILPMQLFIVKQKPKTHALVSILSFIIHILLNIYLIAFLKLGVLGFLYASLATPAIIGIGLFIATTSRSGLKFSQSILKGMFVFGFPFVFSSILTFFYMFSDRFFLEKFSSLAAVGLYSLAWQFGGLIDYITWPIAMAISPFIGNNYKFDKARSIFSRLNTYSTIVCLFFALGLVVYIDNLFLIGVGKEFISAYKLVPILVLAFLFRTYYNSLSIGIWVEKKTKYFIYIIFLGTLASIAFNLLLIPYLGTTGAAIAKVITFAIMAILGYQISQKLYYIPYEFKRIGLMIVSTVVLYFISTFVPVVPLAISFAFFASIAVKGIIILVFPLGLFLLGFFKKDELDKLKEILSHFKHDGFRKTLNNYFLMK